MFERFTDRARRTLVLAQEEARMLHHDFIGTEHLLLGIIHEGENVAALVLGDFDIQLDGVRQKVEELVGTGSGSPPSGSPPFTPRAKKVLELSLREALRLGHSYIGCEHILLGLIREGVGVAAQSLTASGADLAVVREAVVDKLASYHPTGPDAPPLDEPTSNGWVVKTTTGAGSGVFTSRRGDEVVSHVTEMLDREESTVHLRIEIERTTLHG